MFPCAVRTGPLNKTDYVSTVTGAYTSSLLTVILIALSALIVIIFKVMYLACDYRLGFTIEKHDVKEVSSYFLIQAQKGSVGPFVEILPNPWFIEFGVSK